VHEMTVRLCILFCESSRQPHLCTAVVIYSIFQTLNADAFGEGGSHRINEYEFKFTTHS
jgi:hypothetical protein